VNKLHQSGKTPFFYSITPFLIYRCFETIRTYINHERINVKLVGSGRNDDYKHDGFSHDATDVESFLDQFGNINQYHPDTKEGIPGVLEEMLKSPNPGFISLRR